jgi:hypothetical protein
MAARVPALALVCLVLAACGGKAASHTTSSPQSAAAERAHAARWSAGLRRWGNDIRAALDGISVLFAEQASLDSIESRKPRTQAALLRYEHTLTSCSATIRRLGAPPVILRPARREALRACVSLEEGARVVEKSVREVERGLMPEIIGDAGDPLGVGEDGVRRALLDLAAAR